MLLGVQGAGKVQNVDKYVKRLKLTRRVASFLYGQGFFFRVYLGPEVLWLLILQLYDSTVSGQRSRVEGGNNTKGLNA